MSYKLCQNVVLGNKFGFERSLKSVGDKQSVSTTFNTDEVEYGFVK